MSVDSSGADAGAASAGGEIVLIRHAETEWSLDGRHTGRTDIPLTEAGRALAGGLPERLARWPFATVLCSPSKRARETCELAGLGALAQTCEALYEWDYG
ncbi:MAG TPA: histidine phosphatase family protein, partial [Solirubrobacteraceae bacterium]|nr:histidine phosphatase family protein [Solirubrobacteraceae bacterium]